MTKYAMILDSSKCINCRACVIACQQENGVPYGDARNWVKQGPDDMPSLVHFQPGNCMQCDEPLCVTACPTGATWKDDVDGIVKVDTTLCIGCGSCIQACPYGARYRDDSMGVVDKCNYCPRLREMGQEPACVAVCPTRVRIFGDLDDPKSEISKTAKANKLVRLTAPNTDTKPDIFYIEHTAPMDWPKDVEPPLPMRIWQSVLTPVTKYVGGMTLLGIGAVALKQFFTRKDEVKASENEQQGRDAS